MPVAHGIRTARKIKPFLERVERKAARFVTGNYDRTASVTGMLQDLKWDTLETIRRQARLSALHKMCHGFLDRNWGDYLIPNREGEHEEAMILNLLY